MTRLNTISGEISRLDFGYLLVIAGRRIGQAAYPRVGWGTHEDETAAMTGFQQRRHYAKSTFPQHDRGMTFWS